MYKEEAFETEDKCWRENELGHGDMEKRMCVCYPQLIPPPQTSCTGSLGLEGRGITHTIHWAQGYVSHATHLHISQTVDIPVTTDQKQL